MSDDHDADLLAVSTNTLHRRGRQANHWLSRIEALKPGDPCEVKTPVHFDNTSPPRIEWHPATVVTNGMAYYWRIKLADGKETDMWIESIRCPGQTEAWPR